MYGCTTAGRSAANVNGIQNLIAPLVRIIPVRARLRPSIEEMAHDLQEQLSSSIEHEYCQLGGIIKSILSARRMDRDYTLFDTIFDFEPEIMERQMGRGVIFASVLTRDRIGYPLSVRISYDNNPGAPSISVQLTSEHPTYDEHFLEMLEKTCLFLISPILGIL